MSLPYCSMTRYDMHLLQAIGHHMQYTIYYVDWVKTIEYMTTTIIDFLTTIIDFL